jgi:hypothetical protein
LKNKIYISFSYLPYTSLFSLPLTLLIGGIYLSRNQRIYELIPNPNGSSSSPWASSYPSVWSMCIHVHTYVIKTRKHKLNCEKWKKERGTTERGKQCEAWEKQMLCATIYACNNLHTSPTHLLSSHPHLLHPSQLSSDIMCTYPSNHDQWIDECEGKCEPSTHHLTSKPF